MTTEDTTGQVEPINVNWTGLGTTGKPDRGPEWDPTVKSVLSVSHTISARAYMLQGNPTKALETLDRPFTEAETVDHLRVTLWALHLRAEANLELGTRASIKAAAEHAREGLELSQAELGQETIYADALFITLAEAMRRAGDLSPKAHEMHILEELLRQIEDENRPDHRYKALLYMGYRTLAFATSRLRRQERLDLLRRAYDAHEEFLAGAEALGVMSFISEPHDSLLAEPGRSAPFCVLTDFPFPSQGPTSLPTPAPRPRPRSPR